MEKTSVSITGRIMLHRSAGAKLLFLDIFEDNGKCQVFCTADFYKGDFDFIMRTLKRGDLIGVEG